MPNQAKRSRYLDEIMNFRRNDALLSTGTMSGNDDYPAQKTANAARRTGRCSRHTQMVRQTIRRAVLTVVFAVLTVAFLFYSIVQLCNAYALAQHYQAVQGHVVQTQCASHLQVRYAFSAGGTIYAGSATAHKRCDAYRMGEPIDVYYSPADPAISLSEETPQQQWRTRLALVLTEIAVLAVIGLTFRMRRKP